LKVIGTRTIKVTERDETMCTLEAVRYVPEARYNLISIGVLDRGKTSTRKCVFYEISVIVYVC